MCIYMTIPSSVVDTAALLQVDIVHIFIIELIL
jgi:hypothetical protein